MATWEGGKLAAQFMALSAKQRRSLLAESHPLKPLMAVGAEGLSETSVEHLRQCFTGRELIKVRVQADDGPACDALAAEIVQRVPCELVRRVGRVLVLYHPPGTTGPTD